tara:strand:- start:15408 stop:15935 length:528 start_codon:yes stop_codon:yes gene_type:complete
MIILSSLNKQRRRRATHGLKWVSALDTKPPFARDVWEQKMKGKRRAGVVYEKKVADYLEIMYPNRMRHGQWFHFEDDRGTGWCQTDILILPETDEPLVIIEVKLTHKPGAKHKLKSLYQPIVHKVWPSHRIIRVQVCKNLTKTFDDDKITDLADVFDPDFTLDYATWCLRGVPTL